MRILYVLETDLGLQWQLTDYARQGSSVMAFELPDALAEALEEHRDLPSMWSEIQEHVPYHVLVWDPSTTTVEHFRGNGAK